MIYFTVYILINYNEYFSNSDQHDAHEFFMFTLDTLHSELRDEKTRLLLEEEGIEHPDPNKIDTLMSSMFRGFLLSEVINFYHIVIYLK